MKQFTRWTLSLLLIWAGPLFACSLKIGTVLPANYELVQQAEGIVVARAKSTGLTDRGNRYIVFRVDRVLKGDPGVTELRLPGHLDFRGTAEPGDLSRARPGAYDGMCFADDYRLGHDYLLLLRRIDTGWDLHSAAFSRVNEEISGPGDPWLQAVEHYVRIGELSDHRLESDALTALRDGYAREIPGLAADIEHWFDHPSPRKPVEDNIALLVHPNSWERREQVLWVLAQQGDPLAGPVFESLMDSNEWLAVPGPVSHYMVVTGNRGRLPDLVSHYPAVEDRWTLLASILELAEEGDQELLLPLLPLAGKDDLKRLAQWFAAHPHPRATENLRRAVDGQYESRWDLSIELAVIGDRGVLEWAAAQENAGHRHWVVDYVLARSPLPDARPHVARILESGDRSRQMNVVDAQTHSPRPNLELVERVRWIFEGDPACLWMLRGRIRWLVNRGVPGSDSLLARVESDLPADAVDPMAVCF